MDFETSGLDLVSSGVWQIGAIDLQTGEEFLEEAQIDVDDIVQEGALKVTGKNEEELRDSNKQSQKEMFESFVSWLEKRKVKNFICQNPQFDVGWFKVRIEKYGLKNPFHHRSFDLHSIAQTKYKEIKGNFLIKEDHSDMGLSNTLTFCGLKEERIIMGDGDVIKDGKPHNALEDCKLTVECFSRLIYGKNFFEEFKKFEIPDYLKNRIDLKN